MGFEVSDELEKELEKEGADENTVWLDVTFTIEDIQFIVQNGNTMVYITDDQNNHYKTDFDEFWILAQKGDEIQAQYKEENQDDSILTISSYQ
jgi:D-hexose-6-phosphate mutarotase